MDWETRKYKKNKPEVPFKNIFDNPASMIGFGLLFLIGFGIYSSFYTVQTDERAVVTRFGKYKDTRMPGLQFKLPYGVDKIYIIKTSIMQEEFGFQAPANRSIKKFYMPRSRVRRNYDEESLILTGDLNVADVEWVVHYKIVDPKNFIFKVRDPIKNIRDISQATMRRVVGDRTVNEVLNVGRSEIADEAKILTQEILDKYEMGIQIEGVKLQDVNPPESVKPSFNEVTAAKQEQEQVINIAERKRNSVIPKALGEKERKISEAKGYSKAITNRAEGDVIRFTKMIQEYEAAPEVTRTRLYLETLEEVMEKMDALTFIDPNIKGVLPIYSEKQALKFNNKK